jgi:hypothetical protein
VCVSVCVLNLILFSRALRVKKSFEKVLRDALFSFLKTKYFRVSNPNSSRTENIFSLSLFLSLSRGGGGQKKKIKKTAKEEEEEEEEEKEKTRKRKRTNERTDERSSSKT